MKANRPTKKLNKTDELKTSKLLLPIFSKREQVLKSVALLAKNLLDSISASNPSIPSAVMQPLKFVLGSSIDVLLSVYSSKEMERRLRLLLDQLNKNFQIIDKRFERVDENFEIYWRKTIRGSLESSREEKIKLFANVLTSCVLDNSKPFSTKSSILNDLDFIGLEHVRLLKTVHTKQLKEEVSQRKDSSYKKQFCSIEFASEQLKTAYPNVWKLATDLLGRGLLIDPEVGFLEYDGFKKMAIPKYGEYFIETIKSYES